MKWAPPTRPIFVRPFWALALPWLLLVLTSGCRRASPEPPRPTPAASAAPGAHREAPGAPPSPPAPRAPLPPLPQKGGEGSVSGRHGVVTSVEPNATRAGIAMLEQGGNAVDAAVAVAYALAVTHPSAGNIGGGGFMLVRLPGAKTVAIDFRETAPAALTQERFDAMIQAGARGADAVGVPGSVAGLNLAHARFGKLPRARVLEPAIALARDGFALGERQAKTIRWAWRDLRRDPASKALFGRGESPLPASARLRNPALARVLERIARRGNAGFYSGPTADALVAALGPKALLTREDLAAYRARIREPLRFPYRGFTVETMPPPSAGGVVVTMMLRGLERLAAHELPPGSAAEAHLFLELARRAQAERRFGVVDPDSLSASEQRARRARWLDGTSLIDRVPIDRQRATPSERVHPLYGMALKEVQHTTHFSVVDADGGVVSCTTTLSASFGARFVAEGVVLNNSVASFGTAGDNRPAGGKRTISSMAPTLLLRGGEPFLVLGTPGGDSIPSTIVQVLRHVVDHEMDLADAVNAPRLHHGFVPDEARYERARPPPQQLLSELRKLGHRLASPRAVMGDANDVLINAGVAHAYADPREGGLAAAARPAAILGD